jgi:hypothetical protein
MELRSKFEARRGGGRFLAQMNECQQILRFAGALLMHLLKFYAPSSVRMASARFLLPASIMTRVRGSVLL